MKFTGGFLPNIIKRKIGFLIVGLLLQRHCLTGYKKYPGSLEVPGLLHLHYVYVTNVHKMCQENCVYRKTVVIQELSVRYSYVYSKGVLPSCLTKLLIKKLAWVVM